MLVDKSADKIVKVVKVTGAAVSGPILCCPRTKRSLRSTSKLCK